MRKRRNINKGIFHIRLGPHIQKIDLKNPAFLKVLEQQYATKYLENMGVQTSSKNIAKILKQRPLETCQIIQNRFMGGLHTDTITIITSSEASDSLKQQQTQSVSKQMLKILDLKKMSQKTDNQTPQNPIQQTNFQKLPEQQQKHGLQYLNFNIKYIKNRYIFPFNSTFIRKNNYKIHDLPNLIQKDTEQSKLIFQSNIYKFPFTQIKLSLHTLKQLQIPINIKLSQVIHFLQRFCIEFPKNIFPICQNKKNTNRNIHLFFDNKAIDRMFQIIKSQQNAKFIGVFLHLSNWVIFGGVNPIQIDLTMKKKMFLMISQTIKYFQLKTQNKKNWITLVQPMLILTLKISLDYFYHIQYPKLFIYQQSKKYGIDQLAFDKIMLFIDRILDQGNINGRFIFLQSDIDGPKDNFIKDKKFIRKRIFGVSPGLHIILPQPKDGKTRLMISRNVDSYERKNQKYQNQETQNQKQCRQKLLNLALLKIRNRIDQLLGSNTSNPIIRLSQDKDH